VIRESSTGAASRRPADTIEIAGATLAIDPAGALYWPDQCVLAVADLHLEKGSSYARRGVLLPPYDTAATLERLSRLIGRYAPRVVIALGDSFHDGGGPDRLGPGDRAALGALQSTRDWIWVTGNHDPEPARHRRPLRSPPGDRSVGVPSPAGPRRARRRGGRSPAPCGAHQHPCTLDPTALLCGGRQTRGDASVRCLCGRAQCARSGIRRSVCGAGLYGARPGGQADPRLCGRALPAGLNRSGL